MSEFYWGRLFVVMLATILPFLWIFKSERKAYFFIWYVAFTFLYAGVGACYSDCNSSYLFYYIVYLLLFGGAAYFSQRGIVNKLKVKRSTNRLNVLIYKYGDLFIWIHIFIAFVPLVYPSFKLMNLFSPPQVTLQDLFFESLNESSGDPLLILLLKYIDNIVLFFYYVSLYKYRNDFMKLIFFMILPLYLQYAQSGYMARSGFMPPLLILLIHYFYRHPEKRKKILVSFAIACPMLLFGMAWFTYYRAGVDSTELSLIDGINLLIKQECNYPSLYNDLISFDKNYTSKYLNWLVTLPLPGFFKDASNDYFFNAIFTENLTGISRDEEGFSVLLPGVVNESIFIFGKTFFWVMPIIYGYLIGKVFKLLNRPNDWFVFLYIGFFIAFNTSRASTSSTFPYLFKHFLIYILIIMFITKYKIKIGGRTVI